MRPNNLRLSIFLWMTLGISLVTMPAWAEPARKPVVLELFTSNSCEQCPPAVEVMQDLQRSPPPGVDPIILLEHVDYWNPYGWVDRYSSPQYTKRQLVYGWANFDGKVYTPQVIIGGQRSTVGRWKNEVRRNVREMASQADRPILLDVVSHNGDAVDVKIAFDRAAGDDVSQIWLALVQDDVVSRIGAGQNGGRTLHEDGLVRTLIQPDPVKSDHASARDYRASLTLPEGVDRADLSVVAFAQRPTDYAIVGATRTALESP